MSDQLPEHAPAPREAGVRDHRRGPRRVHIPGGQTRFGAIGFWGAGEEPLGTAGGKITSCAGDVLRREFVVNCAFH